MSLILKSNVVAQRSMGNIYGLRGPLDFGGILDFEKGAFSAGGQSMLLEDAVIFSRASAGLYLDSSGTWQAAPTNAPRIHSIPGSQRSGLLLEPAMENILLNPELPSTQTVSSSGVAGGWMYFWLRVWGSGSATLSSSVPGNSQTATLTAKEGQPVVVGYVAGTGDIDFTVTVTGSLNRFELYRSGATSWGSIEQTPIPVGATSRAKDFAELSTAFMDRAGIGASEGTIVVAYAQNRDLLPGSNVSAPWASLASKNQPRGGIHLASTDRNRLRVSGYAAGSSSPSVSFNQAMADVSAKTMGVSWSNSGSDMLLANNGIVTVGGGDLTLSSLDQFVLSGGLAAQTGNLNAVVTHIVFYARALTAAELQEVTKSWL